MAAQQLRVSREAAVAVAQMELLVVVRSTSVLVALAVQTTLLLVPVAATEVVVAVVQMVLLLVLQLQLMVRPEEKVALHLTHPQTLLAAVERLVVQMQTEATAAMQQPIL